MTDQKVLVFVVFSHLPQNGLCVAHLGSIHSPCIADLGQIYGSPDRRIRVVFEKVPGARGFFNIFAPQTLLL